MPRFKSAICAAKILKAYSASTRRPKTLLFLLAAIQFYGQYDRSSNRILINPGKWLERPKNFYNTVMVGSFDPVLHTFSAYFQGITGCTSFEARNTDESAAGMSGQLHKAKKKPKARKKKKL